MAIPCENFRQATESEGKAFRMFEARRASFRNAPRTTEYAGQKFSPGALLWVTFLGHARKVTETGSAVGYGSY